MTTTNQPDEAGPVLAPVYSRGVRYHFPDLGIWYTVVASAPGNPPRYTILPGGVSGVSPLGLFDITETDLETDIIDYATSRTSVAWQAPSATALPQPWSGHPTAKADKVLDARRDAAEAIGDLAEWIAGLAERIEMLANHVDPSHPGGYNDNEASKALLDLLDIAESGRTKAVCYRHLCDWIHHSSARLAVR